jgi:hypothetical protein
VGFFAATSLERESHSYAEILRNLSGLPLWVSGLGLAGAIAAAALSSRAFLARRWSVFWGVAVGLAVAGGWAGTHWIADSGFSTHPVVSHTFTAPLGEALLFLMTSSGGGLSFGVGSVAGVLVGAFIGSLFKGHFRWEACEDPRELRRQMLGAVLMGFGAVLAGGCTIGQGISAFSLFTLGAPLVFAAIFAGAALGLRQLITGFAPIR